MRKMNVVYLKPDEIIPSSLQDIKNVVRTKYAREVASVAWDLFQIYQGRYGGQYLIYDLWYFDTFYMKSGDKLNNIYDLLANVDRYIQKRMKNGKCPYPMYQW